MSKKLFPPKSPLDEILINLPFFISPINLKFSSFSERGTLIFLKSISIFLFYLFKYYFYLLGLKI